jgi:hypothetical protein
VALDAITGAMPASLAILPDELRPGMQGVPADVINQMCQGELQFGAEYVLQLRQSALDIADRQVANQALLKAGQVRNALPHYVLAGKLKTLGDLHSNTFRIADSSASATALALGYSAAMTDLQESNPEVPGIEQKLTDLGVQDAAAALAGYGPGLSPLAGSQPDDSADSDSQPVKTVTTYRRDRIGGTVTAEPKSMTVDLAKAHIVEDDFAAKWVSAGLPKRAVAEIVKMREKLAAG